jgi:hypothetical protein
MPAVRRSQKVPFSPTREELLQKEAGRHLQLQFKT